MRSIIFFLVLYKLNLVFGGNIPLVINTWAFTNATIAAWEALKKHDGSVLDALVEGCSTCEREQCDGTVGYGGSPDENGETTLDAFLMDGDNMNIGAVAGMREIKDAISVARHVLLNTRHTLLVGDHATEFAEMMGFRRESLTTSKSKLMWKQWKNGKCQPNFWTNVSPNPKLSCGPYKPVSENSIENFWSTQSSKQFSFGERNHDTIGMIAIDKSGSIAAGTSTNGAKYKIPGRVGDSPIPGAGAYADSTVGAATATGDGDVMMRFLPSFIAVEGLRTGLSPEHAARTAILRILTYYPDFMGAIIVVNKMGDYSAACHGIEKFPFSVFKDDQTKVKVEYVNCI